MIRLQNIDKTFGKNQVLKTIDLNIDQPGIVAVLGPNGSGKTTMIKSILGLVVPDRGTVYFDQNPVNKKWFYRQYISYLPQIARFPENLRVSELIAMIKDIRQQEAVNQTKLIKGFGLEPYLDKQLRNLSGGTRQKVNILLSLMFDNPVIILDEPTVGLDPVAMIQLKKLILEEKEKGKYIFLTSHIMNVVEEIADEIIFLLEGKIYFRGHLPDLKEMTRQDNLEHAIATILMQNGQDTQKKSNTLIQAVI